MRTTPPSARVNTYSSAPRRLVVAAWPRPRVTGSWCTCLAGSSAHRPRPAYRRSTSRPAPLAGSGCRRRGTGHRCVARRPLRCATGRGQRHRQCPPANRGVPQQHRELSVSQGDHAALFGRRDACALRGVAPGQARRQRMPSRQRAPSACCVSSWRHTRAVTGRPPSRTRACGSGVSRGPSRRRRNAPYRQSFRPRRDRRTSPPPGGRDAEHDAVRGGAVGAFSRVDVSARHCASASLSNPGCCQGALPCVRRFCQIWR